MQSSLSAIPSVSEIDFSDSSQVKGYSHLLFSVFKKEGGFEMGKTASQSLKKVADEAQKLVFEIEKRLPGQDASMIQDYLSLYRIVHRLAFSKEANDEFYDTWMTRGLLKMASGESADRIQFMSWVSEILSKNPEEVPYNVYQWYISVLNHWKEDIREGKTIFNRQDEEDTLKVLTFLLDEDLSFSFKNENRIKKELVRKGIAYLEKIAGNTGSSDKVLINALNFTLMIPLYMNGYDYEAIRLELLKRLSDSHTLNRFSRQAYQLDYLYESA